MSVACTIVSPGKCHSTGGFVSVRTGLKKNLDNADTKRRNSERMLKGQNMRPIQWECIVLYFILSWFPVSNCFCLSSIQMWWSPQRQFEIKYFCLCRITSDLWCLSNRSLSAIEADLRRMSPGQIVSLLDESVFVSLPVSQIFPQSDESH